MPASAVFPWTWAIPADWPVAEVGVVALAFVWGAMFGSFLNVVVHRMPRGRSVVKGGSACPTCGAAVRWRDNVPVIGWLLLRGRCRDCGAAISVGYLIVEVIGGVVAAVVAGMLLAGMLTPDWVAADGMGGQPAIARPVIDRIIEGDWRPVLAWLLVTIGLLSVLAGTLLAVRKLTKRS